MRFHRFLDRSLRREKFHSSGYAQAGFGEAIGSTSNTSTYAQRRAIDTSRSFIPRYRDSSVAWGQKQLQKAEGVSGSSSNNTTHPSTVSSDPQNFTNMKFPKSSSRSYDPYQ